MRALKTTLLLAALSVLLVLGGGMLAGQNGLYFGFAAMAAVNLIAYFASDKIALAQNHAQPVTREQAPRLYEVMERLCGKSGIPMPKLYVTPEEAPNAFATGRSPHHASVAVTAELMKLLNDEELEGVIAHELSHVRNYDILITSVAAMLAGTITLVARMAFWFGGAAGGRRGNALGSLLMMILGPLAAVLLQLGISSSTRVRRRRRGREAGGPRGGTDFRAGETRRIQQTHPDECVADDGVALYRGTAHVWVGVPRTVLDASAAGGADRGAAEYDGASLEKDKTVH
jgi:heat shock protein HtpX